jgi:hypothetical protein
MGISHKKIRIDGGPDIVLKDIILFKDTDLSKSSEAYFEVRSQPDDTCPMINDALSDINRQQLEIDSLCHQKPKRYSVEKCDYCSLAEDIAQNEQEVESTISELEAFESALSDVHDNLDKKLRKLCSAYRNYGNEVKEVIWSILGSESPEELDSWVTDFNSLKKTKPQEWLKESECSDVYDEFKIRIKMNQSDSCSYCANLSINETLVTYMEELDNFSASAPQDIELALNNLLALDDWVDQLETQTQAFIDQGKRNLESIFPEVEYERYIQERNKKEIEFFYDYWAAKKFTMKESFAFLSEKAKLAYPENETIHLQIGTLKENLLGIILSLPAKEVFINNKTDQDFFINSIKQWKEEIESFINVFGLFATSPETPFQSALQMILSQLKYDKIKTVSEFNPQTVEAVV